MMIFPFKHLWQNNLVKTIFFLLNKMSCKQESLLFNMMIFQTFMAKQSHKNYFFLLMSCKQVIPSCGSQNCILFVFVFFKMVILRWVAVNMLLTNRKHSRPFFKIFFDIEVSKVRPKLTFMKKKKYISELLSAIYFMLLLRKYFIHT